MMIIRQANQNEILKLKELHDRAVLELCRHDYTQTQLEAWINRSPLEKYYWRLTVQRIFIADESEKMLGYVRWYPDTNELCSICVEPEWARRGIGSLLMAHAEEDARDYNVEKMWLDASLTAVPFYLSLGWEYIALSTEGPLDHVRMEKRLLSKR